MKIQQYFKVKIQQYFKAFETKIDISQLDIEWNLCVFFKVTLFFNNKLMRGNRTIKKDCGAFDAFSSPNLPPLAQLEIDIHGNKFCIKWPNAFLYLSLNLYIYHNIELGSIKNSMAGS